jgi:acid phosphatase (class A)
MTGPTHLRPRAFLRRALPLLFLLGLAGVLRAQENSYLSPGRLDPVALLAPPPVAGSAEQAADLATVVSVHGKCTPEEAAQADSEKKFFIFSFTPAIGAFFQPGKLPKTEALFRRLEKEVSAVTDTAKDHWKRPRPYVVLPSLAPDASEKSFSYPSGHSTHATVYALVLTDLFPDKRDEILAIGRAIGWRRVLAARHYPTDIYAGRFLAKAIVRELNANAVFISDLAAVKGEIIAARTAVPQK